MNGYCPAKKDTMYFIGVTTKQSSIMKVFPKWMEHLGLSVEIVGLDFVPHDKPENYREAVKFIKEDPHSLGALVTTHKLNCFKASKDLFDGVGPYAQLLQEASSISKRGKELWAHAKDPITSGLSLEAVVPDGHFSSTGGDLCLLGAGGSSLALTLYLINKAKESKDIPRRLVVTNRSEGRLEEMKKIHSTLSIPFEVEYHLCPVAEDNDRVVATLKEHSLVVNATGLGKDAPGSPLTDNVVFPKHGYVWEFNYRGDLLFLDQAKAQQKKRDLTIVDGWLYFIHGWTRVIAEVLHINIPTSGPEFDRLREIAQATRT